MKPASTPDRAMGGRIHPQFEGPIGNPKAGKRARYSYRGGWHTGAIAAVVTAGNNTTEHAVKSLPGNASK